MRGGEKVLEVFCELFPSADLYTLYHDRGSVSGVIEGRQVRTSFIQGLPFARRAYRRYLPLFPAAIEGLRLKGYRLVLSTSHCVAKGVLPPPGSLHISYIHTPMRYVWDMYHEYFGQKRGVLALAYRSVAHYLRLWDAASSARVDHFIANSANVAEKVRRLYRRRADVIHPPVDCSKFAIGRRPGNYYLIISAFAPYKRIDLAIEAFNASGKKLVIAGSGQEWKRLVKSARPNIEFLGWKTDDELKGLYQGCRALIFPGEEDFGITPLEAMASGRPVIAFGRGGAIETIVPPGRGRNATGVFFMEQAPAAVNDAVEIFEKAEGIFSPEAIRGHALAFDRTVFKERIRKYLESKLIEFRGGRGNAQKAQSAL
ncbi:MAG: glycosyltransferase [Deltaproteobacteria bacterium]|nr:glycosyltransferase [Deltaproteobacteria bacterium]MBZ0219009.1 glycosyltransferase [Deltaproteobacteria bacterium]